MPKRPAGFSSRRPLLFLFQHLDKVRSDFGHGDSDESLDHDDDAAAAVALDFEEGAFDAVEGAAEDADAGAFLEVYLIGAEVDQVFVAVLGDFDELLHLVVRNDDGRVAAVDGAGEPLEVGNVLFDVLDVLLAGMDEDEVVNGGDEFLDFPAVALGHWGVFHRDEALYAAFGEDGLGLELPSECGAHGEPLQGRRSGYGVVVCRIHS